MASAFAMFGDRPDNPDEPKCHDDIDYTKPGKTDTKVQLVISLALGVTAFLSFCVSFRDGQFNHRHHECWR